MLTHAPPITIFAVIVVYKMLPQHSSSLTSLLAAVRPDGLRLRILVVDNTPEGQNKPVKLPDGVLYEVEPTNPGLAAAYNRAATQAAAEGFSWLLTLDQDTDLPTDFLMSIAEVLITQRDDDRIGAVAGHINDKGRPLSPLRYVGGFWPTVLPSKFSGLAPAFTMALNSASLINVEALRTVGGYDVRFPLNNSDTSLFHRLGKAGKRLYVVRDLVIQHELAIMEREERMSPERYRQLLADERAFWDLDMSAIARAERLFKLMGRLAREFLTRSNMATRGLTWEEIRYRLLTTRQRRLRDWHVKNPTER